MTSPKEDDEEGALVVRIETGASDTTLRRFRAGNPVTTLTIGSQGAWKVLAPGVAAVHAYLRFDGRQLLVATSDPKKPVVIDGQRVPETWFSVNAPCRMALGDAELLVERESSPPDHGATAGAAPNAADEGIDDVTRQMKVGMASETIGAQRDLSSMLEAPSVPSESTRLQFGRVGLPDLIATRAVQVGSSLPPALLEPPNAAVDEGAGPVHSSTASALEKKRARGLRRFGPKILLVAGPALLSGIVYGIFSSHVGAPGAAGEPRQDRAGVVSGSPAALPIPSEAVAPPLELPLGDQSNRDPAPIGDRGLRTPERRAADAFAAGDFAGALMLYRELAAAHPDHAAYRHAVRILEERQRPP